MSDRATNDTISYVLELFFSLLTSLVKTPEYLMHANAIMLTFQQKLAHKIWSIGTSGTVELVARPPAPR